LSNKAASDLVARRSSDQIVKMQLVCYLAEKLSGRSRPKW